jgi:hypothetical protein
VKRKLQDMGLDLGMKLPEGVNIVKLEITDQN